MQDEMQRRGEDRIKTGHWFIKRLPLIFAGYFVSVILAGVVYPLILTLLSVFAQLVGNEAPADSTFTFGRLLPIALIGTLFAVGATIIQFVIAVTIAEIKQIRSYLYYVLAGMLTGFTASLLFYDGLNALSAFGAIFTISGAGIGYVYWFIAIKSEEYGLDNRIVGSAINIVYRYIMSIFIAIMTGGIFAVTANKLMGASSLKLYELPLALMLTILMALPYTVVGMVLSSIPFLIFVYISNEFNLKLLRHYIMVGILISVVVYYPNLFSFRPPIPSSLSEISVIYYARFLQSLIVGAAGGYVYWRLSIARAYKKTQIMA